MILTVLVSTGCGAAENVEEKAPVKTVEEAGEAVEIPAAEETVKEPSEIFTPALTSLT